MTKKYEWQDLQMCRQSNKHSTDNIYTVFNYVGPSAFTNYQFGLMVQTQEFSRNK